MENNTVNYKPNTSNGVKRRKLPVVSPRGRNLSDYLVSIRSSLIEQEWTKAKRYGEIALKKLGHLCYSAREEYNLYYWLGQSYLQLGEYSASLDATYKSYLISVKHHLALINIMRSLLFMGSNLLALRNYSLALCQFRKMEQYQLKYEYDNISPLEKRTYIATLVSMAYCYLYQNELDKVREIIENKISVCQPIPLDDKEIAVNYSRFNGEYLIAIKEYDKARGALQDCIRISEKIKYPRAVLESRTRIAVIDIIQGNVNSAISTLQNIRRDGKRLKLNDIICEAGLLLSKCYLLKDMPDKANSIENRIKPILSKLDTVWLYEKTREFEKLYRQLQLPKQSQPVPAVLVKTLNHRYQTSPYKEMVIGSSTAMQEVFQLIEKIAPSDLPILIQGETGTGKELIAQAIHANSQRSAKPFLAFNCGAIPESLLESALFGHTRGAFTGAVGDKKGYIELASGGTLFIDEIANMSAGMQQKLLRVLEEHLVWRIGAQKETATNTRFIFACNQDIEQMVKQKVFREDLFYRINTIVLNLPALRERKEDIPLLIKHFFKKYTLAETLRSAQGDRQRVCHSERSEESIPEISSSALALLTAYPWPGNIRELENEVQRICVLNPEVKLITEAMLSESISVYMSTSLSIVKDILTLKEMEQNSIVEALKRCNGNMTKTAGQLGLTRAGLYRKMKRLGIKPPVVTIS